MACRRLLTTRAFGGHDLSYPLREVNVDEYRRVAYIIHLAPLLGVCRRLCDTGEAGKELIHVNGVDSRLRDNLPAALGDVEAG